MGSRNKHALALPACAAVGDQVALGEHRGARARAAQEAVVARDAQPAVDDLVAVLLGERAIGGGDAVAPPRVRVAARLRVIDVGVVGDGELPAGAAGADAVVDPP